MKFHKTQLEDLFVIEPTIYEDNRGFFFESFNQKEFNKCVSDVSFVQDNHSKSNKGVLRGLHYQIQHTQGKLVRVIQGSVFDVALDIRELSPTFGKWFGIELSAKNKRQLWIPSGFAHGFLTLEDNTEFLYKTTDFYFPEFEQSILWNDPSIGILWPEINNIQLSQKDKNGNIFSAAKYLPY
jgi:dTDP-4-dehydrorhamnose 3,5-epimerase